MLSVWEWPLIALDLGPFEWDKALLKVNVYVWVFHQAY